MMKRTLALWPALVALWILQGVFVALYLQTERSYPFWDYAMYANMAMRWHSLPDWPARLQAFQASLSDNYNLLFALPSLLSFSLFGASRLVFILTNFLFFLIPQEIALGVVLAKVFCVEKKKGLFIAACLAFFVPLLWQPLLHGYPDASAAACLTFALALALNPQRKWKNAVGIGLLLGLAVAFRRPSVYTALALVATLGGFDLFRLKKEPAATRPGLWRSFCLYYPLLGVAALACVGGIEPDYFAKMLTMNFQSLYKAYDLGALHFLLFAQSRTGGLLLLLTLGGYWFLYHEPKTKQKAGFILSYTLVWLVLWALGPAQSSEHYLITVLPLFCFVGLLGLVQGLKKGKDKRKSLGLSLVLLCLAANSAFALWLAPSPPLPSDKPSLSFLTTAHPPWIRKDYDELVNLARYLMQTTRDNDHIVVLSSSYILNQDIFRTIYEDVLNRQTPMQRFLPVTEIDGVQKTSLDSFTGADVYVVPTPAQYHLGAEGQKVLSALYEQFPPSGAAFPLYVREQKTFQLDNGVTVAIWRRKEWTPVALHETLTKIRKIADDPTLEWVAEQRGLGFQGEVVRPGFTNIIFRLNAGQETGSAFLDKPLHPGAYRLGMTFSNQYICSNPTVTIRLRNEAGQTGYTDTATPMEGEGLLYIPFTIPEGYGDPFFLSVDVKVRPMGPCNVGMFETHLEEFQGENSSLGGLPNQLQ